MSWQPQEPDDTSWLTLPARPTNWLPRVLGRVQTVWDLQFQILTIWDEGATRWDVTQFNADKWEKQT